MGSHLMRTLANFLELPPALGLVKSPMFSETRNDYLDKSHSFPPAYCTTQHCNSHFVPEARSNFSDSLGLILKWAFVFLWKCFSGFQRRFSIFGHLIQFFPHHVRCSRAITRDNFHQISHATSCRTIPRFAHLLPKEVSHIGFILKTSRTPSLRRKPSDPEMGGCTPVKHATWSI